LVKDKPDYVDLIINKPHTTKREKVVFDFQPSKPKTNDWEDQVEHESESTKPQKPQYFLKSARNSANVTPEKKSDSKPSEVISEEDNIDPGMMDNPQSDSQYLASPLSGVEEKSMEEEKIPDTEEYTSPKFWEK